MYKLGIQLVLWQHKELQMQKWIYRKHNGVNLWKERNHEASDFMGVGDRGGEEGDKESESHLPGSQETLYFLHLIELHELCFFQNSVSSRSLCILQINDL